MVEELAASAAWYDKALAEKGTGSGGEEAGIGDGKDAALRRRFYLVAQRILASAREQVVSVQ